VSLPRLGFGSGRRPSLTLRASEDAIVFVRFERAGLLVVERRIALSPGEAPRLDLSAYLPDGFRGALDATILSDRPVSVTLEEGAR
jgi:hypothetical protein